MRALFLRRAGYADRCYDMPLAYFRAPTEVLIFFAAHAAAGAAAFAAACRYHDIRYARLRLFRRLCSSSARYMGARYCIA